MIHAENIIFSKIYAVICIDSRTGNNTMSNFTSIQYSLNTQSLNIQKDELMQKTNKQNIKKGYFIYQSRTAIRVISEKTQYGSIEVSQAFNQANITNKTISLLYFCATESRKPLRINCHMQLTKTNF